METRSSGGSGRLVSAAGREILCLVPGDEMIADRPELVFIRVDFSGVSRSREVLME
jgi:hypothetical protein